MRDYEVENEKISTTRYSGKYKIRYSKNAFRNAGLQVGGMDESTGIMQVTQNGDTLVLPFIKQGGRTFLWQANPFMKAWVQRRNNNTAGNAIIPVGDVNDVTQIRDQDGLSYDPSKLNAMRIRYQAKQALILLASPNYAPGGRQNVDVGLYRVQPYGAELVQQISVRGYPGETEDQLYARIVDQTQKTMTALLGASETATVVDNTQTEYSGPSNKISAQINFASMREWVQTKQALEKSAGVQDIQVRSMSPRSAVLDIQHQGGVENLRSVLAQSGLNLNYPPVGQIYQINRTSQIY